MKNIGTKIGTSVGQQELTNILASAIQKDAQLFRKYVSTNELFGGAGALWEFECRDTKLQSEFKNKFNKFCHDLINIGIKNRRIEQVMSYTKDS
ncbi:hypothetical protein [Kordia jejudonensis]|uniref:hypothetical protein n=1 Tax=Kordia jejudonensis TaxID=1348245 RepID=UPI0012E010B9|nr:hypothetical protein [Kordia jejudonensis]